MQRTRQNLVYFDEEVTGVFLLGGDQGVAMAALANTPVEAALAALYARGGVIAGTSAGGAVQARAMIADYSPNFASGNALDRGAADLWDDEDRRGLVVGVQGALLDQHFFQRGRMGRLLGAILRPDAPHVGIGVDAYTGLRIVDGKVLTNVFRTLHGGRAGCCNLRRGRWRDLCRRPRHGQRAQCAGPPAGARRLQLRPGHAPLLGGRAGCRAHAHPGRADAARRRRPTLLDRWAGAGQRRVDAVHRPWLATATHRSSSWPPAIPTTGQPSALRTGWPRRWAKNVETVVLSNKSEAVLELDKSYRGIVVVGRDQSLLQPQRLAAVKEAWLAGTPLLLDGGAAAIAGPVFSAHGPPPEDADAAEIAIQRSFLAGRTVITDGLALLDVTIEPKVLSETRWGRLFSLGYTHPELVAFAVTDGSALAVTASGAKVLGDNAVLSLDLRGATLALGDNEAFVIANGLLDVFAPGDEVLLQPVAVE